MESWLIEHILQLEKTIAPIQLLKGLPELLNTCAFLKILNLQFGTEHKVTQEHNACLCLSREACGNDQSFGQVPSALLKNITSLCEQGEAF